MSVSVENERLTFSFPTIDADARMSVAFKRTFRVPDDETSYRLPPGLGNLQMAACADVAPHPSLHPSDYLLPMWQSEATWISFTTEFDVPYLIRINVGGINAVTGEPFGQEIDFGSEDHGGEDYIEAPEQPWLDGFRVDPTTVRQFVAAPLGSGYTVAEQLSGSDDGCVVIEVTPLRSEIWRERRDAYVELPTMDFCPMPAPAGMGLGAGGKIRQTIAIPIEPHDHWDTDATIPATVRVVNSTMWTELTGLQPDSMPLTIAQYRQRGFRWYTWYDESLARQSDSPCASVKTVREVGEEIGENPLPDNESFTPPEPFVVGPTLHDID